MCVDQDKTETKTNVWNIEKDLREELFSCQSLQVDTKLMEALEFGEGGRVKNFRPISRLMWTDKPVMVLVGLDIWD